MMMQIAPEIQAVTGSVAVASFLVWLLKMSLSRNAKTIEQDIAALKAGRQAADRDANEWRLEAEREAKEAEREANEWRFRWQTRIGKIEGEMEKFTATIEKLNASVDRHVEVTHGLGLRVEKLDATITSVERSLEGLERRLDRHDSRFLGLENRTK